MTTEKDELKKLRKDIDKDQGLASKRRLLIIVSMLMLALQMTGAKIEEANTFIFKITFTNQAGLSTLLLCTIFFLMIRYYNYAKDYHDRLYTLWTDRLTDDDFYCFYIDDIHDGEPEGLISRIIPNNIKHNPLTHDDKHKDFFNYQHNYHSGIFQRYVQFTTSIKGYEDSPRIHKEKRMVLWLDIKYRYSRFFTHRENLDIHAPYWIATLALISHFIDLPSILPFLL